MAAPKVDGFAITALVFGVLGGVLFSVVFAIVALRRIGRGERRGKGLAISALCLSMVWVVALVGLLAFAAGRHPARTSDGSIASKGTVSVDDLRVGDCLEIPRELGVISSVPAMPCSQLHNAQVFTVAQAAEVTYPGQDQLEAAALRQCQSAVPAFLGTENSLLHVVVFVPTQRRWDLGVRSESCLIVDRQQDITGDIRQYA